MFKEIVVAFDGSKDAEAALLVACDLAAKYQAHLHVIHVPDVHQPSAGVIGTAAAILPEDELLKQSGEVIIKRAETLAEEANQSLSSAQLVSGSTAQAIREFAHDKDADLIVSGRRGAGGLKGMLTGSVSQELASGSNCAVLTVKTK